MNATANGNKEALKMLTCGKCAHCVPEDVCGCDCECTAKRIEVSQDDDIQFYGENGKPCKDFTKKLTKEEIARDVAIMDEYAAIYNSGLPRWAWI